MACVALYETAINVVLVGVFNCPLTTEQENRWREANMPKSNPENTFFTYLEWDGYISSTP